MDAASGQYVWKEGKTGLTEVYEGSGAGRILNSTDSSGNVRTYAYAVSYTHLGVLLEGSGLIEWQAGEAANGLGAYEQVELKQLRDRVLALVTSLPERERHIVRAHYMQDIPFQDIAAELGLTKGRISQSVSYTHLDVYKRQAPHRPSAGCGIDRREQFH